MDATPVRSTGKELKHFVAEFDDCFAYLPAMGIDVDQLPSCVPVSPSAKSRCRGNILENIRICLMPYAPR